MRRLTAALARLDAAQEVTFDGLQCQMVALHGRALEADVEARSRLARRKNKADYQAEISRLQRLVASREQALAYNERRLTTQSGDPGQRLEPSQREVETQELHKLIGEFSASETVKISSLPAILALMEEVAIKNDTLVESNAIARKINHLKNKTIEVKKADINNMQVTMQKMATTPLPCANLADLLADPCVHADVKTQELERAEFWRGMSEVFFKNAKHAAIAENVALKMELEKMQKLAPVVALTSPSPAKKPGFFSSLFACF